MQLLFVLLLSHFRYLDLFNLSSQFLYAAVSVDAVGDVISEGVAHHASAVGFVDTVGLAQAAEGVAA